MKTNLDKLTKEINIFENKAGFNKTSKEKLKRWLKEEVNNYNKSKSKEEKQNKLIDIIILITQIARRDNISLDEAYIKWEIKSKKYLK